MQLAFRPAQRATASAFPLRAPISARPKASRSKASSARREQAPLQLFFVRLVRGKRGRTFTKRWGASANLLFRRAPSNQITARLFRRWASKYAAQAADQTRDTVLKRQLPPFFFFSLTLGLYECFSTSSFVYRNRVVVCLFFFFSVLLVLGARFEARCRLAHASTVGSVGRAGLSPPMWLYRCFCRFGA